jgi:hypothetical protein
VSDLLAKDNVSLAVWLIAKYRMIGSNSIPASLSTGEEKQCTRSHELNQTFAVTPKVSFKIILWQCLI